MGGNGAVGVWVLESFLRRRKVDWWLFGDRFLGVGGYDCKGLGGVRRGRWF